MDPQKYFIITTSSLSKAACYMSYSKIGFIEGGVVSCKSYVSIVIYQSSYVGFYYPFHSQFYKEGKKHTDVRLLDSNIRNMRKISKGLVGQTYIRWYYSSNTWVI